MRKVFKAAGITLALSMLASSAMACDCDNHQEKHKFYVGAEFGISGSLKNEFKHKDTGVTGSLKASPLYGAQLGYKFYDGMAAEAGWQHKYNYTLNFKLPEKIPGLGKTPGKTKVVSNIFMLGLVYDFPEVGKLVPYIGFDAGIARISFKHTPVYKDFSHTQDGSANIEIFRIKKGHTTSPAGEITLGISSGDMFGNLKLNLSGRVQIIKDAKIHYEELDPKTGGWSNQKTLRQTLGLWEAVVGVTYDLF